MSDNTPTTFDQGWHRFTHALAKKAPLALFYSQQARRALLQMVRTKRP